MMGGQKNLVVYPMRLSPYKDIRIGRRGPVFAVPLPCDDVSDGWRRTGARIEAISKRHPPRHSLSWFPLCERKPVKRQTKDTFSWLLLYLYSCT